MQLLFLENWLNEQLLKSFCWTLIHSLWQGLIAAALAGLVILFTRQSSARIRYNLLGTVLVLFLVSTLITFIFQLSGSSTTSVDLEKLTGANAIDVSNANQPIFQQAASPMNALVQWLNDHVELFMSWWAVFFLFNSLKLLTGIGSVGRLCRHRVHDPGNAWKEKVDELATSLGLNRKIKLLQSELVKVPATFGYFKPVILLPLGLLAQLPADQVETILLHELAHIRRRDYVVNIFQKFAESVFFFNPALIWISSLIRQEREACCDDIVMANIHHRSSYLNALVSFQEVNLAGNNYAMTIATKRNYLLNRVRRMLTRENKKLNLMEKVFLSTGLIILMAFTIIPNRDKVERVAVPGTVGFTTVTSSTPVETKVATKPVVAKKKKLNRIIPATYIDTPDTLKKKMPLVNEGISAKSVSINSNDDGKTKTENTTIIDQTGKKYTLNKVNNKITLLSIDGQTIPESDYNKHTDVINKIESVSRIRKEHSIQNSKEREEQRKHREASQRVHQEKQKEITRLHAEQSRIISKQRDEIARINDQYRKQQDVNRKRDTELRERQRREIERVQEKNRRQLEINKDKQRELERKMKNTTQLTNNFELSPLTKVVATNSASKITLAQSSNLEVKPINTKSLQLNEVKSHNMEVKHINTKSLELNEVKSGTFQLNSVKAESLQPREVKTRTLESKPVKTEPLKLEPSKPENLKKEQIKVEPSSKSVNEYKPTTQIKEGRPSRVTKRSFT